MGFPVAYTELFLPKLLLHTLSLLGLLRRLISFLFHTLGLSEFLESDPSWPDPSVAPSHSHMSYSCSYSALLLREILPVARFQELDDRDNCQDSCAVCLYEFEDEEEIRRLTNCRHIFHRSCLDPWLDQEQRTCPLCRTPFIPDDMQESFNERMLTTAAARGVTEF